MPRKILLNDPQTEVILKTEVSTNYLIEESGDSKSGIKDSAPDPEILKAIILQFPSKVLFSIQETANALSVSIEFIRKRIADGVIISVSMGDRKMISIHELTKLIHKGV